MTLEIFVSSFDVMSFIAQDFHGLILKATITTVADNIFKYYFCFS